MLMLEKSDWLTLVELLGVVIGRLRYHDANPGEVVPTIVPWVEERWQTVLEHKASNEKATDEAQGIQAALAFLERKRKADTHAVRWDTLEETSPSGKTLFKCRACGRVSPTPDKACPTDCQQVVDREEWLGENRVRVEIGGKHEQPGDREAGIMRGEIRLPLSAEEQESLRRQVDMWLEKEANLSMEDLAEAELKEKYYSESQYQEGSGTIDPGPNELRVETGVCVLCAARHAEGWFVWDKLAEKDTWVCKKCVAINGILVGDRP